MNGTRITNLKNPIDDNDVATKVYVDSKRQVIEVKSEIIMLSSGRIIRGGIGGPNESAIHIAVLVNGSVISTFNKPINQRHAITKFQNPIEVSNGDLINCQASNQINIFAIWIKLDL